MNKTLKALQWLFSAALTLILSLCFGGSVMMAAAAADLPHAGKTTAGEGGNEPTPQQQHDGVASISNNELNGDEHFIDQEIDRKVIRIRPSETPLDTLSRHINHTSDSKQMNFFYPSIGTRPISTTMTQELQEQNSGSSVALKGLPSNMFTLDDTIRVIGVKAQFKQDGTKYDEHDAKTPDLVLHVCKIDDDGNPVVFAVNGKMDSATKQPILVPRIPNKTKLLRMGKACSEKDVQTGRFTNLPTTEEQYCQIFQMQVEQTKLDKISSKNFDWTFSDMEEDSIYDMRRGMEASFMFGDRHKIAHVTKMSYTTWYTGGIWWMAGKDIELGKFKDGKTTIDFEELVDLLSELFTGDGCGSKRKVILCGKEVLTALTKTRLDKLITKLDVNVFDLTFTGWKSEFGELDAIYYEFLDLAGMSDQAFVLDPDYLYKKKFKGWTRTLLDLEKSGVRRTDAVVFQEASALFLRCPDAHARIKLKKTA